MTLISRITAVTLMSTLLVACGASKVAVRPEAKAQVQTIALIKVAEPPSYTAQDFGNPGMMFGGIGGAVAGASSSSTAGRLNQIADKARFAVGERFTQRLEAKLSAAGYKVKTISVARANSHKLLDDYKKVDAQKADAILDLALESVGYATEHPMFSPHWRPAAQVKVAMVSSLDQGVIYQEKFMYGYHNPLMSGTDLDAPKAYHFKNKDALFADEAKLVQGMEQTVDAVVHQIAVQLAK